MWSKSKLEIVVVKHIPNLLTLFNLSCGCYGVVAVFQGDIQTGAVMVWAGALFDFLDGFVARALNRISSIGKDLDSFADLVTFCFLPATILFSLIEQNSTVLWLPFIGYILVIFGAIRLAKFNNDTRQSEHFYGLPVPASGIFVSSLPFVYTMLPGSKLEDFVSSQYTLIAITILLSFMMVSDVKLMSLKFKDFSFRTNWSRYLLIVIAIVLISLLHVISLPIIIILYVVLSMALNFSE